MNDQNNTRNERDQGKPYKVGYGKPPAETRFQKGQSGNPFGRPRKEKPRHYTFSDAPSDLFFAIEAYRLVTLRENGKQIELPALQAVFRSMMAEAIKGRRLSQQKVLELIAGKEKEYFDSKLNHYAKHYVLKKRSLRTLSEYKRKRKKPPMILPHPDDIVLDPHTFDVSINGPRSEEDLPHYEYLVKLRNHLFLQSAHARKIGKTPLVEFEGKTACRFMFYATSLDRSLPKRYRLTGKQTQKLVMEHESLNRREREKRIELELDDLKRNRVEDPHMPPESKEKLEQIAQRWFEAGRRRKSKAASAGQDDMQDSSDPEIEQPSKKVRTAKD